jgi:hypothetical protein
MHKPTWYGVIGVAEVEAGKFHRAGLGRIIFPHPPVINLLLRRSLSEQARYNLSLSHEFGHLQTFPIILIYFFILIIILILARKIDALIIILLMVSTQALWEIFAESYAMMTTRPFYRRYYRGKKLWPRLIFWITGTILIPGVWIIFLI